MPDAHENAADTALAVYGSLAPGQSNHEQLASLQGSWRIGCVRGRLMDQGWAAATGYPGLVLDDCAGDIGVQLFESSELPRHWSRLDEFEGQEYARVPVVVRLESGERLASIYVVAEAQDGGA